MRLVSKDTPSPKLLDTVAPDLRKTGASAEPSRARFSRKGATLFSSNGRAIFVAIAVGTVGLSLIGVAYTRHQAAKQQKEAEVRLRPVDTNSLASSSHSTFTPAPIMVQINASQIQATAIALGEPRLAIINGKHVTEGDSIVVQATPSIAVNLRVVKIADGLIDLSDGTYVVTVRLHVPGVRP